MSKIMVSKKGLGGREPAQPSCLTDVGSFDQALPIERSVIIVVLPFALLEVTK